MKTSKKILLATVAFFFIMIFATFFEVKAEMKDYKVEAKTITEIGNFSNVVVLSENSVSLTKSDRNELISNAGLESINIKNDTLYIDTDASIDINYKSLSSITLKDNGFIFLKDQESDNFKIVLENSSRMVIQDAEIKNLSIFSDNSSPTVSGRIDKITGNIKNNSELRINGSVKVLNIKCDNNSNFYKY